MLHFIISSCYNSNSRTKYYTYKYSSTQIRIFPFVIWKTHFLHIWIRIRENKNKLFYSLIIINNENSILKLSEYASTRVRSNTRIWIERPYPNIQSSGIRATVRALTHIRAGRNYRVIVFDESSRRENGVAGNHGGEEGVEGDE